MTYKLKLNNGDMKAVQGDMGHSQLKMIVDVYSRILDEDRQKNATLIEEAFYGAEEDKQEDDIDLDALLKAHPGIAEKLLTKLLASASISSSGFGSQH